MRILMLTPRLPFPPDRGDRLRSWAQLEFLGRRHELWLAALSDRRPTPDQQAALDRCCARWRACRLPPQRAGVLAALGFAAGRSFTTGCHASGALRRTVRDWSRETWFDAVLAFSSAMAPYVPAVRAARRVLDLVDVDSEKWRTYARQSPPPLAGLLAREAERLARDERRFVSAHDLTLVCNRRELAKLARFSLARDAQVLRTCIDVAAYRPLGDPPLPAAPLCCTLGSFHYRPNIQGALWLARHVWPRIRAARPDARWQLVGRSPCRAIRRLARLPGVTVTGSVPDVRPFLDATRVMLHAVHGELGVPSKVIVALAAGVPGVITPNAAAGVDFDGRPPFEVAADPRHYAEAALRLLSDDERARALRATGWRVVQRHYTAENELARLEHWLRRPGTTPIDGAQPPAADPPAAAAPSLADATA